MENSRAMLQLVKDNAPDFWVDDEYQNKVFIMKNVPKHSDEYEKCFTAWRMTDRKLNIYRVQNPITYGRFLLWKHENGGSTVTKFTVLKKSSLHVAITHNFDRRAEGYTGMTSMATTPDWLSLDANTVICVVEYHVCSGSERFDKNWYATYVISQNELDDTALNLV